MKFLTGHDDRSFHAQAINAQKFPGLLTARILFLIAHFGFFEGKAHAPFTDQSRWNNGFNQVERFCSN